MCPLNQRALDGGEHTHYSEGSGQFFFVSILPMSRTLVPTGVGLSVLLILTPVRSVLNPVNSFFSV